MILPLVITHSFHLLTPLPVPPRLVSDFETKRKTPMIPADLKELMGHAPHTWISHSLLTLSSLLPHSRSHFSPEISSHFIIVRSFNCFPRLSADEELSCSLDVWSCHNIAQHSGLSFVLWLIHGVTGNPLRRCALNQGNLWNWISTQRANVLVGNHSITPVQWLVGDCHNSHSRERFDRLHLNHHERSHIAIYGSVRTLMHIACHRFVRDNEAFPYSPEYPVHMKITKDMKKAL
jgi:hypothetical protein